MESLFLSLWFHQSPLPLRPNPPLRRRQSKHQPVKLKLGPAKESQSQKAAAGAEKATKVDNKAGDEVEKKGR